MNWFRSLNIKYKFGLLNFVALDILAVISFWGTNKLGNLANHMSNEITPLIVNVKTLYFSTLEAENVKYEFLKELDPKVLGNFDKEIKIAREQLEELNANPVAKKQMELLKKIDEELAQFEKSFRTAIEQYQRRGRKDDGIIGDFRKITHEVESHLKDVKNDSIYVSLLLLRRHEKDFLLREEKSYIGKMNDEIATIKEKIRRQGVSGSTELLSNIDRYNELFQQVVESTLQIRAAEERVAQDLNSLENYTKELNEFAQTTLDRSEEELAAVESSTKTILGIAVVVLVVLASLISAIISNGILNRIKASVIALSSLSSETSVQSSNLKDQAIQLNEASIEQAAATQETSASMAEMESMIKTTATEAQKGNDKIREIAELTEQSTRSAQDLKKSMEDLSGSKEDLERVLQVIESVSEKTQIINDIVFKTQLLSFNASIEAARAGQYGRGFSVVAEEIAQLANTSGNAARDIEQLTSQGVSQVKNVVDTVNTRLDRGSKLSMELIDSFNLLHQNMNSTLQSIDSITHATEEQKLGIEQTNQAIIQLDSTVSLFTASASTISGTSEVLEKNNVSIATEIENIKSTVLGGRGVEVSLGANYKEKPPMASHIKALKSGAQKARSMPIEDDISAEDFDNIA